MPSLRGRNSGSPALSDRPGPPERSPGEVVIEALTWRPYGRREPVLRDISLRIRPGERLLLVGPSGSGKSTLLRAIAGLLETADAGDLSGSVRIDGAAPGARPGAVGLVLQEPGAGVVASTVARDVAFGLENVGMPRAGLPPVVTEALAAVDLRLRDDTPTDALSGGQTQRLALAGSLALEPSVLLLDEPTAMLDPEHAAQVRASVDAVVGGAAVTTVVVEHVLGPWVPLVDRLIVLSEQGRIVADGPVGQILADEGGRLLEMGVWVPGAPAPIPTGCTLPEPFERWGRQADDPASHDPLVTEPLTAEPLTVLRTRKSRDADDVVIVAAELSEAVQARPGELTVLVGPSGSGKSTILHALAGFLRPDRGSVTAKGRDPASLSSTELARHLAWVPQWSSSTILTQSVLDEVLATSRALGHPDEHTVPAAHRLLDDLGLGHLVEADPRDLSGGEQRRLAIAAALLHGPPVLLADEPTVGQDRHTWAALVGLVSAYRRAGGAVVAATHDSWVIARADTTHVLEVPVQPPPRSRARPPLLSTAGPLALLLAALLAIPAGVLTTHWRTGLGVIAVETAVALLGLSSRWRLPRAHLLRSVAWRLVPGLLAALSVAWSTWFLAGRDVEIAASVALRVLVITIPSAVLIPLIDPDELGDHLAQRLHLPSRPVVATTAALQRVQSFGAQWLEMSRARRVRGMGATWRQPLAFIRQLAALTMGLLVRSLRAAATLAIAMDARGFATASRRTWWGSAPWRIADTLVVLLAALPLTTAIVAG